MSNRSDVAKSLGVITAVVLAVGIALAAAPALFFLAVNQIFSAGVEHSFINYIAFWIGGASVSLSFLIPGRGKSL